MDGKGYVRSSPEFFLKFFLAFEVTDMKVLEQENLLQQLDKKFFGIKCWAAIVENWWICINEELEVLLILNTYKTPPSGGFSMNQKLIVIEQDVFFPTRRFLTAVEPRNRPVKRG